jgi:hypothetical protein
MTSLTVLVSDLVEGRITIQEACREAQEVVTGSSVRISGLRRRVLSSTSAVQQNIAELATFTSPLTQEDPRKWAGALLMIQVLLASRTLDSAMRIVRQIIETSGGICPQAATPYIVTILDSLLACGDGLSSDDIDLLEFSRTNFVRRRT